MGLKYSDLMSVTFSLVLTKTMNYDKALFRMALENTANHRESEYIFKNEDIKKVSR